MNTKHICIGLDVDSLIDGESSNTQRQLDSYGRDISVLTRPEVDRAIFFLGDEVEELFEIVYNICSNLGKELIVLTPENYDFDKHRDKTRYKHLKAVNYSQLHEVIHTTLPKSRTPCSLPLKRLSKIDSFIENNISREIREEEVANLASFSTTYFSKFFRKHKKISFQEYLSKKRVELSKQLLASQPSEKVSSIAFQVGYSDVSYFNRVFKKHTSLTPTEYRQNVVR